MTSVEQRSGDNRSEKNHSNSGERKDLFCQDSSCAFSYFVCVCFIDSNLRLPGVRKLEKTLQNILNGNDSHFDTKACKCIKFRFNEILRGLIETLSAENISLRRTASQCLRLLANIVSFNFVTDLNLSDFISLVMCYGLSSSFLNVQTAVCTAVPHIFSQDLIAHRPFVDIAQDFEPLLRCLLELFIRTDEGKSSLKYAFVSLAKTVGKDVYKVVEKMWENSTTCEGFRSTYIQLSRRLTSGLFHLSANFTKESANKIASETVYPTTMSFESNHFLNPVTTDFISSIRFEDMSAFLCRTSFDTLLTALYPDFSHSDNKCQSNLMFIAEELRERLVSNLATQSGWRNAFGCSVARHHTLSSFENMQLSQSRPFLCLLEVIKKLSEDCNFNIVLCSLDLACILLDSFQLQNRPLRQSESAFSSKHMDNSLSAWLVTHFVCMLKSAFSDGKLVVRVAATKLALSMARLPCAPMIVIRKFVGPALSHSSIKPTATHSNQFEKRMQPFVRCGSTPKHSRLAQEAVDLTTALLLTLPSADFNISEVCQLVVQPGLSDQRPLVRVATLDCVAVVAHLLGPGNLGPLLAAVSRAENHLSAAGDCSSVWGNQNLLEAVQARLVRRQLPQLDSQHRVVRGFRIGASSYFPYGVSNPDGNVNSSLDVQNDAISLTDMEDPANIALRKRAHLMSSAPSSKPDSKGLRRRPSAGLTRPNNRLPWDPQTGTAASSSGVSSAASPRGPESVCSIDRSTPTVIATGEDSARTNSGHRSGQSKRRMDTITNTDGFESQSLPSTSRMSPVPLQPLPLPVDRNGNQMRASQGFPITVPSSNTTSATNTPRGKPVLAPLRRSSSKGVFDPNGPWTNSNASIRPSASVNAISNSLLPTRATMGRQSGRSWRSVNASVSRNDSVNVNRFGYQGLNSPIQQQNPDSRLGDSQDPNSSARRRSRENDKSLSGGVDAYDNDVMEEIYDDDYENDDDDDDDEALLFDEDLSSDSDGRKVAPSRSRSQYALGGSKIEAPPLKLDNSRSLCRSIDSELSEVCSIRSAASHRRAMRLFEEAERQRHQDELSGLRKQVEEISHSRLHEPLRVSVTEANCAIPVLDPPVIPALPTQSRITMSKAAAQRRTTSNNQPVLSSLSGPPTHLDQKTSMEPDGPTSTGAKYNPYTGASFRQNPDYSDLVIGRATGLSATSAVPTQLSSTPDLHRLSQNQAHGSHERRPLRGQHNIQNLSPNGPHSTPLSEQAAVLSNDLSINVVGKGLFDSPSPQQQQTQHCQLPTNPASGSRPINASENGIKSNRPSPSIVSITDTSTGPVIAECTDERQMLGASVVGIGLTEPGNSAPPNEKPNISTIEPEAQVSSVFRQRIIQKKNKELQKLRKGPNNPEPDELHVRESASINKTTSIKSDVGHRENKMQPSLGEIEDKAPSVSTWPPAKRNSVALSQNGKLTGGQRSTNTPTAKAPLPPKYRHKTAEQLPSKCKTTEANEVASTTCSPTQSESVYSTESENQPTSSAVVSGTKPRNPSPSVPARADERPLVKGRSALNLSLPGPSVSFALQLINSEDWEAKVSGLEQLAQLALEKPNMFSPVVGQSGSVSAGITRQPTQAVSNTDSLGQAVQAVITECRNLRSQVSRQAVQTMSNLFQGLGRAMDSHVDLCVRILLGKTGEAAAAFLRDEVTVALSALTQAANPSRAINAFLQHGLGHKNPAVRLQTALQVAEIVEQYSCRGRSMSKDMRNPTATSTPTNSGRISSWSSSTSLQTSSGASSNSLFLSGLMERLVTAVSQFLTDGNQETRYHGRRLLSCLIQHPDFEKTVRKQLTGQTLRVMRDAIDQVHTRGVGELPNASASSRRRGFSPAPNASRSRGSSAGACQKS